MASRVIIAHRVFIPCKLVDEETVKEYYERDIYVENTCRKCPVIKNKLTRPNIVKGRGGKEFNCLSCIWSGYTGHFKSYKIVNIKGKSYYSIPAGDLRAVRKRLGISFKNAIDLRCDRKTRYPLKFTGKLFTGKELRNGKPSPNQSGVIRKVFAYPGISGVIKARPRFGKTVLVVYLACKMRRQTLIMAHEKLLLDQFYDEFQTLTDIKRAEKRAGKKLLVIAQNEKDLASDAPYLLINYQKFITELGIKRLAKYIVKRYGILFVDEIHRSPTDRYNELLNKLDCKYKIGVTATDNRKDGKYVLTLETLGPVIAEGETPAMNPVVYLKQTAFKPPRQWRGRRAYGKAIEWLSDNEQRNFDIVRQVFYDLRKDDKTSIVIPVARVKHAKLLTKLINRQAKFNNKNKGEEWPDVLAETLWAGVKGNEKKELLNRARSFKTRVVIAIAKFVRDGINVPAWTHMYVCFPGSNVENSYQNTQRVCTPYEGKKRPVIRLWHDPIDIMTNCVKNTYRDSYLELGYRIGSESKEKLDALLDTVKVGREWKSKTPDLRAAWGSNAPKRITTVRTR